MHTLSRAVVAVFATLVALPVCAVERQGIHNGDFSLGVDPHEQRPRHWIIGFPGDLATAPGGWELVTEGTGGSVLELRSASADQGFWVSQIVDLPAGTMAGVTVRLEARVQRVDDAGWAAVQLAALNPEAPFDPETGINHVGYVLLTAAGSDWQTLTGQVTLSGPAQILAVVLIATGDGTAARFADISVTADLPATGCGPDPAEVPALAGGRPPFPIGITNENPRNTSDAGLAGLAVRAAQAVDMVNLFVHIRWNALSGSPPLTGHDPILRVGRHLGALQVPRMLTFDFTHDSVEGLGDINPMPDGSAVGRLDDPGVADAYLDELLALAEALKPRIVSVGIETDFFWLAHGDQWPDFRDMLCTAHNRLHSDHPGIHVTTYFTLATLVDRDGSPRSDGQDAFRQLLPCVDSVGYSDYWADGVHHVADIPAGYFTAASSVAPDLPLIVPEFGYRGGDAVYSEQEQEAYLRRALAELAQHDVVAAVLYSLYDQTYLGAPHYFQDAFSTLGLLHLDGSPKRSYVMLRTTHRAGRHRRPLSLPPNTPCTP